MKKTILLIVISTFLIGCGYSKRKVDNLLNEGERVPKVVYNEGTYDGDSLLFYGLPENVDSIHVQELRLAVIKAAYDRKFYVLNEVVLYKNGTVIRYINGRINLDVFIDIAKKNYHLYVVKTSIDDEEEIQNQVTELREGINAAYNNELYKLYFNKLNK